MLKQALLLKLYSITADRWNHRLVIGCALLIVGVLIAMIWQLVRTAWPAITQPDLFSATWQLMASSPVNGQPIRLSDLIWGTLKGSLYALCFAVPLALSSAIYTSHFMSHRLRDIVKPIIHMMGAIPSVIVGLFGFFIVTPLIQSNLVGAALSFWISPLILIVAAWVWHKRGRLSFQDRMGPLGEFSIFSLFVVVAFAVPFLLGSPLDQLWFDGALNQWLTHAFTEHYTPHNALILAICLGFAIIPAIYSFVEESLVEVPHQLVGASIALGASTWQTVCFVVVPSALPGIIAGIALGFGRTASDTLIALMVTNNLPLTDMNVLSGLRTLAANLVLEFNSASMGTPLYHALILTGVFIFGSTLLINTTAGLIRLKLRQRYEDF